MASIGINEANFNARVAALRTASGNFNERTNPINSRSTLTASENARSAFEDAQQGHTLFSEALRVSADDIYYIGLRFFDYDEQAASGMGFN